MKLKKNKKKVFSSALEFYDYCMSYPYNFELHACTNSLIDAYDTVMDGRISFAQAMQKLRDTSEDDTEFVRRLREARQKREAYARATLMDKEIMDSSEGNWFMTNYLLKKWSRFRQAYHFSKPLLEAMMCTDKQGFIADVFQNLPYNTFYIDLTNYNECVSFNGDFKKFVGCFVDVCKADKMEDAEPVWSVRQVFFTEKGASFTNGVSYPCGEKTTVKEGVTKDEDTLLEEFELDASGLVVNLIAYIAAANADIEKRPTPQKNSLHNNGVKKKPVTNWDVGFRIGPAIEKAFSDKESSLTGSTGGGHASPRPHIRAAHWHHYWTGPKDNQVLSLRWVSQAFVNCTDSENLPVVEHRSRE